MEVESGGKKESGKLREKLLSPKKRKGNIYDILGINYP